MSVLPPMQVTRLSAMTALALGCPSILRTPTSKSSCSKTIRWYSTSACHSVVQSPTDLAIATKFATMLRAGEIGGTNFTKVVGIGHSYGSVQMQALSATAPQLLDGIILQGFSVNS